MQYFVKFMQPVGHSWSPSSDSCHFIPPNQDSQEPPLSSYHHLCLIHRTFSWTNEN